MTASEARKISHAAGQIDPKFLDNEIFPKIRERAKEGHTCLVWAVPANLQNTIKVNDVSHKLAAFGYNVAIDGFTKLLTISW
jgi:hypothetical protein